MGAAELAARLEVLTTEASDSYDAKEHATRTHRRALVRAYLLWRDCQTDPDFLVSQYAQHGIRGYDLANGNKPNFNPLLRLVFRRSLELRNNSSRIGQRAAALSAMHAEHEDNPKRYRKEAEAKLLEFMNRNGGIFGLIKLDQDARAVREGRPGPGGVTGTTTRKPDDEFGVERLAEWRKAALASAISSAGIARFKPSLPIRVGKDGMLVLLGKREADGTVIVVGSSNDRDLLASTALHATNYTLANLPEPFRVLVEAVRTQMYPAIAMSDDLAQRRLWEEKHADRSHITTKQLPTWDGTGKAQKVRAAKKLVVRAADQSIILSSSALAASVVTLCKPTKGAFPYLATKPEPLHRATAMRIRAQLEADPTLDEDALVIASGDYHHEPMRNAEAALEGVGLRLVERMIETTEIFSIGLKDVVANYPGYRSSKNDSTRVGVRELPINTRDRWLIALQRQHEPEPRLLSFYDTWRDAGAVIGFQPAFDFAGWQPEWQVDLEPVWFGQLREALLDDWFVSFGNGSQVARASNQAMRLTLDANMLTFEFNFDPAGDAQGAPVRMPIPTQHKASWLHLSRDIATTLYNVADAEVVGKVTMSGNANALVLAYSTAVAAFSIAVPTAHATRSGVSRNIAAFSELRYG